MSLAERVRHDERHRRPSTPRPAPRPPSDGAIVCKTCHSASYFPTGWIAGARHQHLRELPRDRQGPVPHTGVAARTTTTPSPATTRAAAVRAPGATTATSAISPTLATCTRPRVRALRRAPRVTATTRRRSGALRRLPRHADVVHAHTSSHDTSGSGECVTCHADQVSLGGHGGCATCHANPILTANGTRYLKGTFTADCVSCHNATVLGTHSYTTPDPNHYVETTHTATPFTAAAQGTGADGTVPAEGKECSLCHSSTLKTAHATVSTSGGSVTCVECHTDTTLGSSAQVAANWTNDRCTDCHDTGARTDARRVRHGPCRLDDARLCQLGRQLPRLHRPGQVARQEPVRRRRTASSCANAGCHVTSDTRPAAIAADSCGTGSAGGCHADKTTATTAPRAHTFTSAPTPSPQATPAAPTPAPAATAPTPRATTSPPTTRPPAARPAPATPRRQGGYAGNGDCQTCHDGRFTERPGARDASRRALQRDHPHRHRPDRDGHRGRHGERDLRDLPRPQPGIRSQGSRRPAHQHHPGRRFALRPDRRLRRVPHRHARQRQRRGTRQLDHQHLLRLPLVGSSAPQHGTTAPVTPATSTEGCGASGTNCHTTYDVHALHKDAAGAARSPAATTPPSRAPSRRPRPAVRAAAATRATRPTRATTRPRSTPRPTRPRRAPPSRAPRVTPATLVARRSDRRARAGDVGQVRQRETPA